MDLGSAFQSDFERPHVGGGALREAGGKAELLAVPHLPHSNPIEYVPGGEGRLNAWVDALFEVFRAEGPASMGRVVLDSSHQGSGKSHAIPALADQWLHGDFSPSELLYNEATGEIKDDASSAVFYVSKNFRSPSIPAIAKDFQEIPTRHQGLVHTPGPDGSNIRRTITAQELKDGQKPDEPATCVYAHRLHSLSARGFSYSDATESFCVHRCPHRPVRFEKSSGRQTGGDGTCPHRENTTGFWEGHKGAEEPRPASPRIRCSVQALEGIISLCPELLSQSIVIFDESDQLFDAAIKSHHLSHKKLSDMLAFTPAQFMHRPGIQIHPDLPNIFEDEEKQEAQQLATARRLTEQLLTQLIQLMQQLADQNSKHGIDHHQVRQHFSGWIDEVVSTYCQGDELELPDQWQLSSDAHLTRPDDFERAITSPETDNLDNLPSPLLPTLIHCILGAKAGDQFSRYSLTVTKPRSGAEGSKAKNYRITLTTPSGLLPAIAERSAAVLVGDATANPDLIRSIFTKPGESIAFKHIRAQSVSKADRADVQFFQVKDMGAMARRRGGEQIRRLEALRHPSGIPGWAVRQLGRDNLRIGYIDHKDLARPGDGKWQTGSARGGNMFEQFDVLVLIGKPIKNVSAALSEYVALTGDTTAATGCSMEENSPGFLKYQAQLIAAELQQAWERLRIIRRPGEQLLVLFVSDADLSAMPIDVIQIKAGDITPQADQKTDQKYFAIRDAILELAAEGFDPHKISAGRVNKLTGISKTAVQARVKHQHPEITEKPFWAAFVELVLKEALDAP